MTPLAKRITAMEDRVPVGCPTCRMWHGTVIADSFGGRSRPDQCADCGRAVTPTHIIFLEGVAWDCV